METLAGWLAGRPRHKLADGEKVADLPSRDDILKFIADQPGKVGKREIARAFRVNASERIALQKLLREMTAEGLLEGARKSGMRVQGDLPNVCVIRVTGRDSENNLVARAVREGDVYRFHLFYLL